MDEKQFHSRIYWLTFVFSVLVVWLHACNGELFLGASPLGQLADRLERVPGELLGQMSVPGFFMVSAYLFYRRFDLSRLGYKWRSRVRSVLVPYCLWNFLYYAAYWTASRIPGVTGLVGRGVVPSGWGQLADAVLFYQYNPVFWYLYQLILLIVLAPLIYGIMRRGWLGAGALVFLAFAIWKAWDIPQLNEDALFYYCVGAWASLHRQGAGAFVEQGRGKAWILPGLILAGLAFGTAVLGRPGGILWNNPLATVLTRLILASAAWMIVSCLPLPEAPDWMRHSFFLYAVHFALVRLINKVGARLWPGNFWAALGLFVIMPALMTAVSYALVRFLKRFVPVLYGLLSGGRA